MILRQDTMYYVVLFTEHYCVLSALTNLLHHQDINFDEALLCHS